VDDDAIAVILQEATGSSDACARLVQRALDNGGRDNVTVIVAAYRFPVEAARTTQPGGSGADTQAGR
jgi:serine/threonine protein phosphatase PrpC